MKNKHLQLFPLWKKGTTLTLGLGLLSGSMSTQAATNCNAVTEISTIECESLLELYHSTNGAEWKYNDGWNVTNTPCSWYRISCENNSIVEIVLGESYFGNNLVGTIPDFSGLPNLQKLDLSHNQLTGEIPNFTGLPNLQTLSFWDNQLTGKIPDFSGLPNLQELSLSNNQLTGKIPNFSGLPNLQTLYLIDNQLTGEIPDFSGLPNLKYLYIRENQLTSTSTTDCNAVKGISKIECESLLQLYHSTNGPNWITNYGWNLTNMPCSWYGITCDDNGVVEIKLLGDYNYRDHLFLGNQLTDEIPDFSGLPNLQKLFFGRNQLMGSIPDFSGLPNLQTLNLSNNQLTGSIPDFSGMPNLQSLELDDNQLTGEIPNFSGLPNLQKLSLYDNQLKGLIPDFTKLPNLRELNLNGNQIEPDCSAITEISQIECESLLQLYHSTDGPNWLFNNGWNFTNTPCSWYGITCKNNGVVEIDLRNSYRANNLVGTIPDFSGLPNLQTLNLSNNQLTGEIPNFSGLPNLQGLYLSDNQLTDAIPYFSALSELKYLDIRNNPICKDSNINYSSWPIKHAKEHYNEDEVRATWQEELNTFPNCPANPLSATVKMQLNQSRYTTSNPLRLDMQVNGQAMVDLYVAIVFPDGDFMTITYPLAFNWLNAIQIYQPVVEIAGEKTYPIMDFPLPADITTGGYHACGVLVLAGAKPTIDPNNWIHSHCASFEVY